MELLELLKYKEVDGIIFGILENEWDKIFFFLKYGFILLCNEYYYLVDIMIIGYDEFEVVYMGVVYLIERGYKKIGFCFDILYSEV